MTRSDLTTLLCAVAWAALLAACGEDRGSGTAHADTLPDVGASDALDGSGDGSGDVPERAAALEGLPYSRFNEETSVRFASVDACALCHVSGNDRWTDAAGRNISPVATWQASMMAHSSRDPYWLAAFAHERDAAPEHARDLVVDTCTRCHAPAANEAHRRMETPLDYDALITATDDVHELGREGATCTVCHQIGADNLGTEASFTGGYEIGYERQIFGPLPDPFPNPMLNHVNYRPVQADHVMQSAMCATCHTVITRALDANGDATGPAFPEQVPYLEWRNSAFTTEGDEPGTSPRACQSCHMPRHDDDGNTITSALSQMPPWVEPRTDLAMHTLQGGNAWMLEVIAANRTRLGSRALESQLLESAARNDRMLRTAATVSIADVAERDGAWEIAVQVRNLSGHRFPTAYPSRRAWLEVSVEDAAGTVVFHSGAFDATGALVGPDGTRLDPLGTVAPHVDPITAPTQVTLYEAAMADASGAPTHTLLAATSYLKDTRLLPLGWSADHAEAAMTSPVGVDDDADFVAGGDVATYRLPAGVVPANVTVRLWYQSVPPAAVEATEQSDTPEASMFREMVDATPPLPRLVAEAQSSL